MQTDLKNGNTQVFFYIGCVYKIQRVFVICNKGNIQHKVLLWRKKNYTVFD